MSLLQLLDQGLHVGRDYFFRGLLLVGIGGGRLRRWYSWVLPPWPVALAFAPKSGGGVYIHAERLLAKAEGCTSEARKPGETPCGREGEVP